MRQAIIARRMPNIVVEVSKAKAKAISLITCVSRFVYDLIPYANLRYSLPLNYDILSIVLESGDI